MMKRVKIILIALCALLTSCGSFGEGMLAALAGYNPYSYGYGNAYSSGYPSGYSSGYSGSSYPSSYSSSSYSSSYSSSSSSSSYSSSSSSKSSSSSSSRDSSFARRIIPCIIINITIQRKMFYGKGWIKKNKM